MSKISKIEATLKMLLLQFSYKNKGPVQDCFRHFKTFLTLLYRTRPLSFDVDLAWNLALSYKFYFSSVSKETNFINKDQITL